MKATAAGFRPGGESERKKILVSGYDSAVFLVAIILVLFGTVMIFSSSYYVSGTSSKFDYDMFYFLVKQLIAVGVGLTAMLFITNFNYHRYAGTIAYGLYAISNILLVYVRLFGDRISGAWRWIDVPVFGSFQPSEFAKLAVIILVAYYFSKDPMRAKTIKGMAGFALILLIPCGLVILGNNMSTMLVIGAIGFCMLFVVSPHTILLALSAGGVVGALALYLFTTNDFRGGRIAVWGNPFIDPMGVGFQTIQSLYAVGSGGLFGLGLGQSNQKLAYMPEPYTDFIFAIICEELGFVGASILLLIFAVLIWRGIVIALKAPDLFGSLIAFGITVMISVQVIINVGVVTKVLPNTGIPLPFISYGGTSVVFIMAMMGLLLNISRYRKKTA